MVLPGRGYKRAVARSSPCSKERVHELPRAVTSATRVYARAANVVRPHTTPSEVEVAEAATADQAEPVEADEGEKVAEEALVAKPLRSPTAPTPAERAAHELTHLPYRSWCDDCVAGRRDNPPHHAVKYKENNVAEVMLDYCFVRRDDETEVITILVMKERLSRAI